MPGDEGSTTCESDELKWQRDAGRRRDGGWKNQTESSQPFLDFCHVSPRDEMLMVRYSRAATTAPRIPTLSIAALTRPSAFARSMNWRAYAIPRSRPFGITMACGSMPGLPSRTREPGSCFDASNRLGLILKIASAFPDCSISNVRQGLAPGPA